MDIIKVGEKIKINVMNFQGDLLFVCEELKLDACYDKTDKKLKGNGAFDYKDIILNYINKKKLTTN